MAKVKPSANANAGAKAKPKLSYDNRLTARTSSDVIEAVGLLVVRLKRDNLKFLKRTIGLEGVIGSALLEFLQRPIEEQAAVVKARLPELEAKIAADERARAGPEPGQVGREFDPDTGDHKTGEPDGRRPKRGKTG